MKKIIDSLNKPVFLSAVLIYTALFLMIIFFPEGASKAVTAAYDFTLESVGWVYEVGYAIVFIALLFFGISKFGKIRLGGKNARPEYSTFGWIGMLCAAGLGVGLVFFGVIEPVTHYLQAPFYESGTSEAATDAMRITFQHWGMLPWGIYTMVGLCIGYFAYKYDLPPVVSTAFYPLLGQKGIHGSWGKVIDSFSLIALVCGISMSLGFAAVQFCTGLDVQFGITSSLTLTIAVAIFTGLCSLASAVSGLKRGVLNLSKSVMWIALGFCVFILIVGPSSHIFKIFFESNGQMLSGFVETIFFLDAFGTVADRLGFDWTSAWTIMYWAWWVAFAPFVGSFLAEISRGRTIREFIFGSIFLPGLFCCLWFTCTGGTAIYLDLTSMPGLAAAAMESTEASLFVFFSAFPLENITIIIALILIIILLVTSMDSSTYMAAIFSVKSKKDSSVALKAFWAAYVIINACLMIYLGGLNTLKFSAIVLAFPFMLIILLMAYGLYKESRRITGEHHEESAEIHTIQKIAEKE